MVWQESVGFELVKRAGKSYQFISGEVSTFPGHSHTRKLVRKMGLICPSR